MEKIQEGLGILIGRISEENYDQTFACCRLWFEITQTYAQKYPDQIFDSLFNNRGALQESERRSGKLIHSAAHLTVRFARDAESDNTLAPHTIGLQNRLCAAILQEFFKNCMGIARDLELNQRYHPEQFLADANFIAHWANLGYVGESPIRDHILQSLISHPKLYHHQACALIVLFKLAGATFEKYVDPSVVDRCFDLLKGHYRDNPVMNQLVQVRVVSCNGWLQPG